MDNVLTGGYINNSLMECIQINSLGHTKPGMQGGITIDLKSDQIANVRALVHNEGQFYIPNYFNLFGSDIVYLTKTEGDFHRFNILRTHLKSIDQPGDRCAEVVGNSSLAECVMKFLRKNIGCHVPLQNMETNDGQQCKDTKKFQKLADLGYKLQLNVFTETQMNDVTGCLSPCEKV